MTWFADIPPCLTGRCVDELQAVNHTDFYPNHAISVSCSKHTDF
ncbi:hypothetical protein HMPREF9141_1429 [Prevotella multiformis DSM 16608]|uniref:Uncharacterized protein n=1 Tax=Prevotella multiformis DSM 16608 TaxID=888743 RepID=F0F762_9BACT|nr:hypothetical protein HMPREF9141_1429 [Prevotella multiformis DSM 16608]